MKKTLLILTCLLCVATNTNSVQAEIIMDDYFNVDSSRYERSVFDYDEWYSNANVEKAALEGTTVTYEEDPVASDNGVVKLKRETTGTGSSNINLDFTRNLNAFQSSGTVGISFKYLATSATFRMKIGNIIQDFRHDRAQLTNGSTYSFSSTDKQLVTANVWHSVRYEFSYSNNEATLYFDEEPLCTQELSAAPDFSVLSFRMDRGGYVGEIFLDEIIVERIPEAEAISFDDIANGQKQNCITENLNLITSKGDYTIEWVSSDENVVMVAAEEGVVKQDSLCDSFCTLSATVKNGDDVVLEKDFSIVVPAKGQIKFQENFDSVENDTPLSISTTTGWNGWLLNEDTYAEAKEDGTEINVKKLSENGSEGFLNLQMQKKYLTSDKTAHLRPYKALSESLTQGIIITNVRFKPVNSSFMFTLEPFGSISHNRFEYGSLLTNSSAKYSYSENEINVIKINEWNTATFVTDFESNNFMLYINGQCFVSEAPLMGSSIEKLGIFILRTGTPGVVHIDDIFVKATELTNKDRLQRASELVEISYEYEKQLILPQKGAFNTNISWYSSNTNIVSNDGKIMPEVGKDNTVILTASVEYNGETTNVPFEIEVKGLSKVDFINDQISFEMISNGQSASCVTSNLNLLDEYLINEETVNFQWETSAESIVSESGIVTRGNRNEFVEVKGTYWFAEKPNEKGEKIFTVIVPALGEILLYEDFETIEAESELAFSKTEGNAGWVLDNNKYEEAKAEGTSLKIVENNGTNVLSVIRMREGFSDNSYINFNAQKPYSPKHSLISYSFRILGNTSNAAMRMPLTSYLKSTYIQFGDTASTRLDYNCNIYDGNWHNINYLFDYHRRTVEFYIDNNYIGTVTLSSIPGNYGNLLVGMQRNTSGTILVDDIIVSVMDSGAEHDVDEVISEFSIENADGLTESVYLPTFGKYGTTISYSENSEAINLVSNRLDIIREKNLPKEAVLYVTVARDGISKTFEVPIIVAAYSDDEYAVKDFSFSVIGQSQNEKFVSQNLNFVNEYNGYTVEWSSSDENVVNSVNGVVNQGDYDMPVRLSAKFIGGAETVEKNFDIVVPANGKILLSDGFDEAINENSEIEEYSDWEIESSQRDADVHYKIQQNIFDNGEFAQADKVLYVERYLNSKTGNPSGEVAYKKVDIKCQRSAIDFDLMFCDLDSVASIKFFNTDRRTINKLFEISTSSVKLKGFSETEKYFDSTLVPNMWYHFSFVFDAYNNTYDVFVNYQKLNYEPLDIEGIGATINAIGFYSDIKSLVNDKFMINNLMVRDISISEKEAIDRTANSLQSVFEGEIPDVLNLYNIGEYGAEINWSSSDNNVITDDGRVCRSLEEKNVVLTASVSKGSLSENYEFNVCVPAMASYETPTGDIMQKIADELNFKLISEESAYSVTKDLALFSEYNKATASRIGGVNIEWSSSIPEVLTAKGKVLRQKYDVKLVLTAKISSKNAPNVFVMKNYDIKVLMASETLRDYSFENVSQAQLGEPLFGISDIITKRWATGTEYGMQYFVGKNPYSETSGNDSSNVIYMHRYFNEDIGTVTTDCYFRVQPDEDTPYDISGSTVVDMKVLFRNGSDLRMDIKGILEQRIHILPEYLEIKNVAIYEFEEPLSLTQWHDFQFFFDLESNRLDVYVDGKKLNSTPIETPNAVGYIRNITFWNQNAYGDILIDDLMVRVLTDKTQENVEKDFNQLSLNSSYSNDVTLPIYGENGSRIKWVSKNKDVITDNGKVLKTGTATLDAFIMQGEYVQKKTFTVNVDKRKCGISDLRISASDGVISINSTSSVDTSNYVCFVEFYLKETLVDIVSKPYTEALNVETEANYDKIVAYVRNADGNLVAVQYN